MYGRAGLDRFKKAQTLEPFSVTTNSTSKSNEQPASKGVVHLSPSFLQSQTHNQQTRHQNPHFALQKPVIQDVTPAVVPTQHVTQVGGAQSTWQPPDWAIEPCPGVYYLEVIKDGEVLDRINLDKRRHIFGRQFHACDFVLDHQSVSRQHAAVIPHKNGSIYVIDLGSAHGTFVANERLTKDSTVELEVGQSLRFAASTRTYVLRKNNAALFPPTPLPTEINQPPSPDPSDEEAVLAYNTFLNRYGLKKSNLTTASAELTRSSSGKDDTPEIERAKKRIRKTRVTFRDQVGGQLVEVVGFSDGADVETEPGPVGVKEGSLVGKYESLVQVTVIPKGKEHSSGKEVSVSPKGMTDKLQEVLNKVKSAPKTAGIYDDLYGESFSANMGSSWAYSSAASGDKQVSSTNNTEEKVDSSSARSAISSKSGNTYDEDEDEDDLFGD